jgi:hypothetical protein
MVLKEALFRLFQKFNVFLSYLHGTNRREEMIALCSKSDHRKSKLLDKEEPSRNLHHLLEAIEPAGYCQRRRDEIVSG